MTNADASTPSQSRLDSRLEQVGRAALRYWPVLALLTLLVTAVSVRLYRLDSVPGNLTADETDFFQDVYRVLHGDKQGWFYQGQPASLAPLGAYAMAWSVDVFGDGISGLRMYTVLLSLATLVPFYLLVRHRFPFLVAIAVTLLLATNLWFLHFSRTAWANMNAPLIATGATAMLLLGLERGRWWWFVGAGVFIGLAPWGYVSARIIPLVVAAFFPMALFIYRDRWRQVVWGFGLAGLVALVLAAPVLNELRQGLWDDYTGRTRTVSIFHARPNSEAWDMVPGKIWDTFQGFILLSNDDNIFRNSTEAVRYAPRDSNLFAPVTRVLFFVGLVFGLWQWRKTALWWMMLLAPLVIQVFSVGTPDAARGLIIVPTIFLFVALGLDAIASAVTRQLGERKTVVVAGAAAVVIVAVTSSALNVRSYFDWMESDYALAERGPMVWADEFAEWSALQRSVATGDAAFFNAGMWRERQDRAGCLTGRLSGELCSYLTLSPDPDPLGSALVRVSEVPGHLDQRFLTSISSDDFRQLHGGRSTAFAETLDEVTVEEAWATAFADDGTRLTANAARLSSVAEAELAFAKKASLTGADYLGGPQSEQLHALPLGDSSVLFHFQLGSEEWWEYFWRDGSYLSQVQIFYTESSLVGPETPPAPAEAALAQAERIHALAGGQPPSPPTTPEATPGPTPTPLPTARDSAPDGVRWRDLEAIQGALEEYHDEHGSYPDTGGVIQTLCAYRGLDAGCELEEVLSPLPEEPLGDSSDNGYWYASDGSRYTLYAQRESDRYEACRDRPEHLSRFDSLLCVQGP